MNPLTRKINANLKVLGIFQKDDILVNNQALEVIDDTYNASPAAVEAAVDVLVELEPEGSTLILGDMLELGKYAEESHHRVGRYAAQKGVAHLVVYGDWAKTVAAGFKSGGGESYFVASGKELIPDWVDDKNTTGAILVKGSRSTKMEEVVEALMF